MSHFGETSQPNSKPQLVSTPEYPCTSTFASSTSKYVQLSSSGLVQIMPSAFADGYRLINKVPYKLALSPFFRPNNIPSFSRTRLGYFGAIYPDGTSLPSIPINGLVLRHRDDILVDHDNTNGERSWTSAYGKNYVTVGIPGTVFDNIADKAREEFHENGGDVRQEAGELIVPIYERRGGKVYVYMNIKDNASLSILDSGSKQSFGVGTAIQQVGEHVLADGLVALRGSRDFRSGKMEVHLKWVFYEGMLVDVVQGGLGEREVPPVRRIEVDLTQRTATAPGLVHRLSQQN